MNYQFTKDILYDYDKQIILREVTGCEQPNQYIIKIYIGPDKGHIYKETLLDVLNKLFKKATLLAEKHIGAADDELIISLTVYKEDRI